MLSVLFSLATFFAATFPLITQVPAIRNVYVIFCVFATLQGVLLKSWKVKDPFSRFEYIHKNGILAIMSVMTAFSFSLVSLAVLTFMFSEGSETTFIVANVICLGLGTYLSVKLGWSEPSVYLRNRENFVY